MWRYNLHYFDDLNAEGSEDRFDLHCGLIDRWVKENPAAIGTGWEPYPCSLRIVNWIKWALAGNTLQPAWQASLALQAAWLSKNIEWHLLGNHLFANAKALVFAGSFLEGQDANRWLRTGLAILYRELPEQILPDGGQFERSPMYHAIALEDVLDLINIADVYEKCVEDSVVRQWREYAGRMLTWLAAMRHPDGEIALFNDSAFGIAPRPDEITTYAERLGVKCKPIDAALVYLDDSGYIRASLNDALLFADVGNIGPDYLPGHAHADTLSFELSLFGHRWFVDSGCSTYEVGEERLRQRGTAAHNTVRVDGQDSSEVWSSFRVARRARARDARVQKTADRIEISAIHDGYERLPGKVTHSRAFSLSDAVLVIKDTLTGQFNQAEANFLLHPDVEVEHSENGVILRRGSHKAILRCAGGKLSVDDATWHPEFGLSLETRCIRVALAGRELASTLTWGGGNGSRLP